MTLTERLFSLRDEKYREFQARLIPNVPAESIIGVRTPDLKKIAKELSETKEGERLLSSLPHRYFEENQLHGFIIGRISDYDEALSEMERFLPYIDNWATCDQTVPKAFAKHKDRLIGEIRRWIWSSHTYTVRFGLGMLMQNYLDSEFKAEYLELAASVKSDEYYINMMQAWFFATALAKQYEAAIPYILERRLGARVHNMAIQKSVESRRIPDDVKAYLRTLKI